MSEPEENREKTPKTDAVLSPRAERHPPNQVPRPSSARPGPPPAPPGGEPEEDGSPDREEG
ncbi:hypothetical protein [Plantactinospora sp. CA-290183]|uniref:hypothetical protein n=1 Tax=Plantactinospora sp. CA-290183 TaxID=3240006 RepID=UPI003D8C43ED